MSPPSRNETKHSIGSCSSKTPFPDNPDVLRHVFLYLKITDLGACMAVCRSWNKTLNAANDVWRAAAQARWWLPNQFVTREAVRAVTQTARHQVDHLQQSSWDDKRSWLLVGNDSPVISMMRLDDDDDGGSNDDDDDGAHHFLVTVHANGQAKAWPLPLLSNRTRGSEIPMPCAFGRKLIAMEKIDDSCTTTQNNKNCCKRLLVVASVDGSLATVQFSCHSSASHTTAVQATLMQQFATHPRSITCLCANQAVVITASGDTISIFPIQLQPNNKTTTTQPLQILQGTTTLGIHINQVEFACQENTLLSVAANGDVCWWNYQTAECLRTWTLTAVAGGPTLLGCNNGYAWAVKVDTLDASHVSFYRFIDSMQQPTAEMQRFVTARSGDGAQRIVAAAFYEEWIVLATKDGHIKEYNIETGKCCSQSSAAVASCPISVYYMSRNALCLLDYCRDDERSQHKLVLLTRKQNEESAIASSSSWTVTRIVPFDLLARDMLYDDEFRTLFVSSQGYLVRAFIFQEE